jgi:hypothetical protein
MKVEALIDAVMELSPHVLYAAVHPGAGEPVFRYRLGHGEAAPSSDAFEERVANPTLLDLARRRGEIGAGGLDYLLVRYRRYYSLLMPLSPVGHLSVEIELDGDPVGLVPRLRSVAFEHGARFIDH